jgi:hypothetical protein
MLLQKAGARTVDARCRLFSRVPKRERANREKWRGKWGKWGENGGKMVTLFVSLHFPKKPMIDL